MKSKRSNTWPACSDSTFQTIKSLACRIFQTCPRWARSHSKTTLSRRKPLLTQVINSSHPTQPQPSAISRVWSRCSEPSSPPSNTTTSRKSACFSTILRPLPMLYRHRTLLALPIYYRHSSHNLPHNSKVIQMWPPTSLRKSLSTINSILNLLFLELAVPL